MQKNLDRLGGLIHSQRVLLALTQKGVSREDAYALVQRNAMPVWRGEGEFLTLLKADKDVAKALTRGRARGAVRPRLSPEARRYDFRAGVRRIMAGARRASEPEVEPGFTLDPRDEFVVALGGLEDHLLVRLARPALERRRGVGPGGVASCQLSSAWLRKSTR